MSAWAAAPKNFEIDQTFISSALKHQQSTTCSPLVLMTWACQEGHDIRELQTY